MAVRIRLRRTGAKKRPSYRIVATDSRMPRDGRFIEILGTYNPIEKPAIVNVNEEKVFHWLKVGALPTDTVAGLFKQIGLWKKWEMTTKGEDVSTLEIKTTITGKTRRKKKKSKEIKEVKEKKEEAKAEAPKEEKKEEKKEAKKEEKKEEKKE